MLSRWPVRRFFQQTEKIVTPQLRFGTLQWVLARPLYRFQRFNLTQVPAKNRPQALQLELAQWTPFANSNYYIGWQGQQALVWGWDADKVEQSIAAQGLNLRRVKILPESVLQTSAENGLCLIRCQEGFEGQFWCEGYLERSRWWAQMPELDEWIMFQRDTGVASSEQQNRLPAPKNNLLNTQPWIAENSSAESHGIKLEKLIIYLSCFILWLPTFWFGFELYKVQQSAGLLHDQLVQLKRETEPILNARTQAQDSLARINALRAISPYTEQLTLMAKIAEILPQGGYIQHWDYQSGLLKITLSSTHDISVTNLIGVLQQAGGVGDVKALPSNDPKNITFQMSVLGR